MLEPGTRVGPYQVLSPLGAGGMGEVYRARDTVLGRHVALKTLPEELARHPQRLTRLKREARILASLNHPGIATLYGVEEHDGTPVLAMEVVEGETLSERLHRGPLPLKETLRIGQQVAEAVATRLTSRECCTGTSSPPTCASPETAAPRCSTSAWHARSTSTSSRPTPRIRP